MVDVAEGPQIAPAADRIDLDYPVDETAPALDQQGGAHPHLHGAQHSWLGSTLERGLPSLGGGATLSRPGAHFGMATRAGRFYA